MFHRICPECGHDMGREDECSECDGSNLPLQSQMMALPASELNIPPFIPNLASCPAECSSAALVLPAELVALAAPEPRMARPVDYGAWVLAQIQPANGKIQSSLAPSPEKATLPGPAIPRGLTSLEGAGIAKVLTPANAQPQQKKREAGWLLSLGIGAGIVAITLGGAFYAMPTLAGSRTPSSQAVDKSSTQPPTPQTVVAPVAPKPAEHPLASAIEVTGIRFVTDIPNRHPQVHYLVVNHSGNLISDATVTVILHPETGSASLSQFSFRIPRLGAYESKEMVNAVDQMSAPGGSPDWRKVHAEVTIAQ